MLSDIDHNSRPTPLKTEQCNLTSCDVKSPDGSHLERFFVLEEIGVGDHCWLPLALVAGVGDHGGEPLTLKEILSKAN